MILGDCGQVADLRPIETCPADTGLNKWSFSTDFTSGSSAFDKWNTTAGTVNSTSLGAKFEIAAEGDAPTIASEFYIFFGHVDVKMRAANGTGIVSTWILESDDLDEIDWVSLEMIFSTLKILELHFNLFRRSKSAPMTTPSRPTTSARETPPVGIARLPSTSPLRKRSSTPIV